VAGVWLLFVGVLGTATWWPGGMIGCIVGAVAVVVLVNVVVVVALFCSVSGMRSLLICILGLGVGSGVGTAFSVNLILSPSLSWQVNKSGSVCLRSDCWTTDFRFDGRPGLLADVLFWLFWLATSPAVDPAMESFEPAVESLVCSGESGSTYSV